MTRPKVSIIHICYNQAAHIQPALLAVLAQDYEPLEIVISDDCSSDDTFEIIQDVVQHYRGPHHIILNRNPENLGIVGNVNAAVALTSGQFIVQVNGDDLCHPNRVTALASEWLRAPDRIKMVFSELEFINEAGHPIGRAPTTSIPALDSSPAELICKNCCVVGAGVGFSRDLFDVFGPIPACATIEDRILPFRARYLGEIRKLPETLLQWRMGGVSWKHAVNRVHPKNQYFGSRLQAMQHHVDNQKAYLIELEKVEIAHKRRAIRECNRIIARLPYFERLLNLPAPVVSLMIVPAYFLTLWRNDRFYLSVTVKYALRPVMYPFKLRRYNRKCGPQP